MSEARGWIPKTDTTFYDVAIMQNILHMSIYLSGPLLSASLFRKLYLAEIPIQGPLRLFWLHLTPGLGSTWTLSSAGTVACSAEDLICWPVNKPLVA